MRLDLRFTARPLKELWCQAVIALVFREPVEGSDTVCGLDSKTLGFLEFLQKKGFWTGAKGETLLIASQDMVKADKILLKGLGDRSAYNTGVLIEMIGEIGTSLSKMAISEIAIQLPAVVGERGLYLAQLEAACARMVDSFLVRYQGAADFILKLFFSVNKDVMGMLEPVLGDFRACLNLRLGHTIVID